MQIDAHNGHDHERSQNGEHQPADADDDPHAPTHRQREHHEHDDDRLGQVDHEPANGIVHQIGLPRDSLNFDTDGQLGSQFSKPRVDGAADGHHVRSGGRGHGQGDSRAPVVPHPMRRRVDVAASNRSEILDADDFITPAGARRIGDSGPGNRQFADGLGRVELAGRSDAESLRLKVDAARVDHHVLSLQGAHQLLGRQSELGQLRFRHVDVNPLVLRAPEVGSGDAGHEAQFLPQCLHVVFQLGVRVAVAGHRQKEAEHGAEVVAHLGRTGTGRQRGLNVANLLAQHVPHLPNTVGPVLLLDIHFNDGHARTRPGVHVLDLAHLLELGLDAVGDFQLHLFRAGAGIERGNAGRLDGELRVFKLAKLEEAEHAPDEEQQGAEDGNGPFFEG